jgi:anti-sigma regulatory factor (Ser/Thr protein kinase)
MQTVRRFRREVPEIPRSRRFVAEVLARCGRDASDAVLLVASELVTNAVRHGNGDVELRIDLDEAKENVRLEVLDDGHVKVVAPRRVPSPTAVGGRGLHLVREVSKRWGSGFDPAGRTMVWAEMPATD